MVATKPRHVCPAAAGAPARVVAIAAADTPYYYGLPIYAEKMVFVIDTSSSMAGLRLVAAKRELSEAIHNLRENTQFAIVVFNGEVGVWQRKLVPANQGNKKAAILFVQSQPARSSTASYDALEMRSRSMPRRSSFCPTANRPAANMSCRPKSSM